jgi:mRNA interferase RelE/StbE
MLDRIAELAEAPYDPKLSIKLTNQGRLRRSRVAGWRIIFLVDDKAKTLSVVTIERRGQVYKVVPARLNPLGVDRDRRAPAAL